MTTGISCSLLGVTILCLCCQDGSASTIPANDRYAWVQSAGWVDFKVGENSTDGVSVNKFHLTGTAYAQSFGWISFGGGAPLNGLRYSNQQAADCGVNIDFAGNLTGYAYAQSVGWINFGWAAPNDPNRPRLEVGTGLFKGYAYAQSAGWINLEALPLINANDWNFVFTDTDFDGLPDDWEMVTFGALTTASEVTDSDSDGLTDGWEFTYFASLSLSAGTSDFDSDGFTDLEEMLAFTDPTDPGSYGNPPDNNTTIGAEKLAWGQSVGWLNWRHGQPANAAGVSVSYYHLRGSIWGQNIGWISTGNGAPTNGLRYSNTSANDCGVNLDLSGNLSGYAYSATCGWINFGWAAPDDPNRARIDVMSGEFLGYAYGQSIGWVNLSAEGLRSLTFEFLTDTDFDGLPDGWELARFGSLLIANGSSDTDGDSITDTWEFLYFRSLDIADATSNYDGDPVTDANEFRSSTHPLLQDSYHAPSSGSSIAATGSYAWGQSVGWINFRHDKPSAPSGVTVGDATLQGLAYSQSTGWIDFGNGSPSNGLRYSNATSFDFGVNHDGAGELSGYAYGQSVGWINFSWATPTDPNRPRVDLDTGAFSGLAYGQSVGWINLAVNSLKTDAIMRADIDFDGISDAWELEIFGNLFNANDGTDSDSDGVSDHDEYVFRTDPLSTASRPRVETSKTANLFTLSFPSSPSRRYTIERSSDLQTWSELLPARFAPDAGATTTLSVPLVPGSPLEFFRVKTLLPLNGP